MIQAALSGVEFLADVEGAPGSPDLVHLWWLGQAGFLVAWNGVRVVIDPYLSDSLTRKYAQTATPHVRMTERVVAPEELRFVDGVLATHHHSDHLDPETLAPLMAAATGATLIVPAAHAELARRRAAVAAERVSAIEDGECRSVGAIQVEAVPAAHESVQRDVRGHLLHLGYVLTCGPFRIYHAGDTVAFPGQARRVGEVDVALLPINGRGRAPGIAGNLDQWEAAQLAADLPTRVAVPCHFEMFTFNTASPGPFVECCTRLGIRPHRLHAGARLSLRQDASYE